MRGCQRKGGHIRGHHRQRGGADTWEICDRWVGACQDAKRVTDVKRTSANPKNRLASHLVDTSSLVIKSHMDDTAFITLRGYLNCLDQEDPQLIDALKEHYIRY